MFQTGVLRALNAWCMGRLQGGYQIDKGIYRTLLSKCSSTPPYLQIKAARAGHCCRWSVITHKQLLNSDIERRLCKWNSWSKLMNLPNPFHGNRRNDKVLSRRVLCSEGRAALHHYKCFALVNVCTLWTCPPSERKITDRRDHHIKTLLALKNITVYTNCFPWISNSQLISVEFAVFKEANSFSLLM